MFAHARAHSGAGVVVSDMLERAGADGVVFTAAYAYRHRWGVGGHQPRTLMRQ
ncbi:MAG: hypothetical protein ACRDO8_01505 [Nocardioidaceae bacterium]